MPASRSDAYISRSVDFRANDRRQRTKPIALPLAHARGVIMYGEASKNNLDVGGDEIMQPYSSTL